MREYETITTHDIRKGDILRSDGMDLLIDIEPRQTSHRVTEYGGKTFATAARVLNWDEVQATGDRLLVSFIKSDMAPDSHRTRNGLAPYTEPRWTIQGNGLAQWARVTK
jgi:hypothetical protein